MVLLSQSQIRHCPLAMAAPSYGGMNQAQRRVSYVTARARCRLNETNQKQRDSQLDTGNHRMQAHCRDS